MQYRPRASSPSMNSNSPRPSLISTARSARSRRSASSSGLNIGVRLSAATLSIAILMLSSRSRGFYSSQTLNRPPLYRMCLYLYYFHLMVLLALPQYGASRRSALDQEPSSEKDGPHKPTR